MPDLVAIPNVELVRVGVHEISTGTWTVERADLTDAVEASRAGIVRDPVVKLGHSGMGDAAPALGRVTNLRVAQGGDLLLADFRDVPRSVAALMPKAWPQRSVEGLVNFTDTAGRTWRFVLTAVALLGAEMPGVDGLADVGALYGIDVAATRVVLAAHRGTSDCTRAVAVAAARRRRTHRLTTYPKG
ncbi:hypothetical protein Mycch_2207 [Mycolicibacterium chubuense NBB4]|uniref:Uncharacterized protein n=1 Tax=Mycolicibacterium chubuense (strain NBB4) TaxID=710421 RepID=I4BI83_MYCCN|nr:hypothetical protein [Mycolicibacterium chubuense]AFM16990.1 hypothetical protein Mycch_2207 [Mycolicibacterium chubuense NBB4]